VAGLRPARRSEAPTRPKARGSHDEFERLWLAGAPDDGLFLSVITVGEIAKGIAKARRADSRQAVADSDTLQSWLESVLVDFSQRIPTRHGLGRDARVVSPFEK
jgi:hypothetical protein